MAGASLQGYATPVRNKESYDKFHSVTCMLTTHKHIVYYCCPIKIGIDMYSFGTAFKQANLTLISKSNPSYVGKSSNCRVF